MFNIIENPWLILTVSIILLAVIAYTRQLWPDNKKRWQYLLPGLLVISALGIDFFIKTDHEKITGIIKQAKKSAITNDVSLLEPLISEDYEDKVHNSKTHLINACRGIFSRYGLKKIRTQSKSIVVNSPNADAVMQFVVQFRSQSSNEATVGFVYVKVKIELVKQGKQWFVKSADLISVNNQPMNWSSI